MLVLTRKKGEAIHIGDEVEVRVLSVQGNRVRLGIEAPAHIDVRRGELVLEVELTGVCDPARIDGQPQPVTYAWS
jgi:carbon storage regulator